MKNVTSPPFLCVEFKTRGHICVENLFIEFTTYVVKRVTVTQGKC